MPKKIYSLCLGLGACHLLLVALGAGYVDLSDYGPVGKALDFYGELSGANKSYGFFAPGVGSQVRARLTVVSKQGEAHDVALGEGLSHEAMLRIGNITEQLSTDSDNADELRRSMAASLAGKVFGRYPGADQVVVHVEEIQPVGMPEFRQGQRPQWQEIYTAVFRKDDSDGAGDGDSDSGERVQAQASSGAEEAL